MFSDDEEGEKDNDGGEKEDGDKEEEEEELTDEQKLERKLMKEYENGVISKKKMKKLNKILRPYPEPPGIHI